MMPSHVNKLSGCTCTIERSFDDCLGQTNERVDSAVGWKTGIDVEQVTPISWCNRIRYRLNNL